ncbi:MAG: AbrB family transcriptional regulator [Lysobacterales bacterium CG17_big_fil_post_rev_8_21_14_2_50_64_11]|nr:MAG: AbrB family transcriptional regulator [Xanthomonadales bacterium CG17_big_fil_post_rev_8_21_14_2_50_64_11]PIX60191.1 MAG: AbrB family transcriptional regulator [Xanthomonadales bacterium CG_4_10_14_3_um_filter_64_11]
MATATITLSSKGQVVIPKEIRDELHWIAGTQIALVSSASGVTLKAVPNKTGHKLVDLIGMFKHEGLPLSIEELCKPVDDSADDKAATSRRR